MGLLLGGGAVLIALIVAAVLLISPAPGPKTASSQNRLKAAVTQLSSAAAQLSDMPGARYQGTFHGPDGIPAQLDLEISNKGSAHGTLTQAGQTVQLLAVDDKTFIKAGKDFWRSAGAPADSLGEYAKQWVKIPADRLGIDVQRILAPAILSRQLTQAGNARQVTAGPVTTIHGVSARQLTTPAGTFYVTTTAPQRIVRIVKSSQPGPGNPGSGRPSSVPGRLIGPRLFAHGPFKAADEAEEVEFDLSDLSQAETEELLKRMQDKVRELKHSIDSQVRFALTGSVTLAPCGTSGCTARVSISNSVSSSSPYVSVNRPVTATVTVNMTLDGRPVASCSNPVTMRPNGTASTSCSASYYIPPARNPTTHHVYARAHAVAQAVATADINRMVADLKQEVKKTTAGPVRGRWNGKNPPKEAIDKVPGNWAGKANKKKDGWRWEDPKNQGNTIRIDKGEPNSRTPSQQVDHVVITSNGRIIGPDGQPIQAAKPSQTAEAHIPLTEWLKWRSWNTP